MLRPALLLAALLVVPTAGLSIAIDDATDDLSDLPASPSAFVFDLGANTLTASSGCRVGFAPRTERALALTAAGPTRA